MLIAIIPGTQRGLHTVHIFTHLYLGYCYWLVLHAVLYEYWFDVHENSMQPAGLCIPKENPTPPAHNQLIISLASQ